MDEMARGHMIADVVAHHRHHGHRVRGYRSMSLSNKNAAEGRHAGQDRQARSPSIPPTRSSRRSWPRCAIAQVEKGWLSQGDHRVRRRYLGMPPIAVYEVATFYNMYELPSRGRFKITVCTNLPCAAAGGDRGPTT
jgi:NADH:ubiquinone oxidoreductase subunit E